MSRAETGAVRIQYSAESTVPTANICIINLDTVWSLVLHSKSCFTLRSDKHENRHYDHLYTFYLVYTMLIHYNWANEIKGRWQVQVLLENVSLASHATQPVDSPVSHRLWRRMNRLKITTDPVVVFHEDGP